MSKYAVAALALFVFSIPSENGVAIPGVGSLTRLIGILALGIGLIALVDRGVLRARYPSLFLVVTALLVLWTAATSFWSIAPAVTFGRIATFAQLGVLVWLIHQYATSDRRRDILFQSFVLGCYLIIAIGVATFFGSGGEGFRDVGTGFNPNGFAIVSALGIPMAWGLMLRRSFGVLRFVNAVYPVFAVVAVVLAASRGGFVTALVALMIIPLTLVKLGVLQRLAILGVVLIGAFATFAFLPQAFPALQANIERLAETDEQLLGGTLTGRTTIWRAGVDVFVSSPIVGIGVGGFNAAVAEYLGGTGRSPHNAFLSVAVGAGLVGLLLFVALFVLTFAGLVSHEHRRIEYVVLLAALLVGMMPTNSDNDKFMWFVLAMLSTVRPFVLVPRGAPAIDAPRRKVGGRLAGGET